MMKCECWFISGNNIPQEVKVDGGELGLNQSPETPEEMRCLDEEETESKTHETQD